MERKNLMIRNSTAEFLIFQAQSQANGVEVMYADETIWCTQDAIATLFDKSRSTITEHLQNIFEEGELVKDSVCRKFRRTATDGKIVKTDVAIAKNYLKGNELESLGRIVNAFLDLAEDRAKRHIPMTMEDWAKYIDRFLTMTDRELLQDNGKVSAEQAKEFAESEFEKYRIVQDRLFMSDFDKEIEGLLEKKD